MAIPFKRVVIIGVGLIGGSIAAAMKELDDAPIVIGIGRHAEPLLARLQKFSTVLGAYSG